MLARALCLIFLLLSGVPSFAATIGIRTDQNNWYPFTYQQDGVSMGLHVDMVREACDRVGWMHLHSPALEEVPGKRQEGGVRRGRLRLLS